jgi:hypothetical protein
MKNLETDEKDGLSSDIIETWKDSALDIARDALEYLNHFGENPASRPDDALGLSGRPLEKQPRSPRPWPRECRSSTRKDCGTLPGSWGV